VAAAEPPPEDALSPLSDPQAPANSVNAATRAINQRVRVLMKNPLQMWMSSSRFTVTRVTPDRKNEP
jgi:hypothetical protein